MWMISRVLLHSTIIFFGFLLMNIFVRAPLTYLLGGGKAAAAWHKYIEFAPYAILEVVIFIVVVFMWKRKENALGVLYGAAFIFFLLFYLFFE